MRRFLPSLRQLVSTREGLRPPISETASRASAGSWLAAGFAAAAAFSFVCRFWIVFAAHLSRLEWLLTFVGLALSLVVPVRFAGKIFTRLAPGRPSPAVLAGGAVAGVVWYANALAGGGLNLWIFPKAVATFLTGVLAVADVTVATVAVAAFVRVSRFLWDFASPETVGRLPNPAWNGRRLILPAIVYLAFANAVTASFASRERFVPYWDYGNYWSMTAALAKTAANSPEKAWDDVAQSVRTSEYNLLAAVLPAAAVAAFGDSWDVYRHATVTVYGTAVAFAAAWALRRTIGRPASGWAAWWPAAVVATLPVLWAPTLRGYVDLGGVALALGIFGLYLMAPARELSGRSALALGVAFAAIFLFRRWYGIWAMSFVAVAACEAAVRTTGAAWRRRPVREWLAEWRVLAVAGSVAVCLLLPIAYSLLARAVGHDYAASYVAYKVDASFFDRTAHVVRSLGWGYAIAFTAAAAFAFADRRTRRLAVYAVAVAVVAHVQFHRIQDLGLHHRMLYAPSFLLVVGAAGMRIIDAVRGFGRPVVCLGLVGLSAFGLGLTMDPRLAGVRNRLPSFFCGDPCYPIVNDDADAFQTLFERANREAVDRHTSFVVVSSSIALNQSHAANVHRALGRLRPEPWRQEPFPEVDKTGGFPDALFQCGVVVVADPVQLHLAPSEQFLVSATAEALMTGSSVGAAFRRLPEPVALRSGVVAWVFVRSRPLGAIEVKEYCERLRAAHPDWPSVYDSRRPVPAWPDGMAP